MASDATPAYRGYRLQALYILWRILTSGDSEHFIFQPEGHEDLAIFDGNETLLEVVQVKAHEEELGLSSLLPPKPKPNSPVKRDSFFYRAASLFRTTPQLAVSLVSFGPLRHELLYALQKDGIERKNVVRKLSEHKILSEKDINNLLTKIHPVSVNEAELINKVQLVLSESVVGTNPENAFDLLNFWLYICAENKRKITRSDVIEKLNNVGRFLNECAAHYQEWFTSIVPIEDQDIQSQKEKLSEEYYQGIAARYSHILADLDVTRPEKMREIAQKFTEHNVVIIHAASGQGKTTLAYRYLHNFFPNMWRFQVLSTENRGHALRIARAIVGHADAINIPIVVYLDVTSSDNGWIELVKQLSFHQNIYILVTIREEDLQRARISGAEFQFSNIDLTFKHAEAQEIYHSLQEKHHQAIFLSFQEAWRHFGGVGPLMEFVYLVTKGNSLQERLSQQVQHLEDELREGRLQRGELELLRLVSIASAYEARLKVKRLVEYLKLDAPARTFTLLEKEYLLRQSDDGSLVYGLHPLRSEILVGILTDATFSPWSVNACTCLPYLYEPDVETFLLYSFSRRQADTKYLITFLETYQPEQWRTISAITQALLWLGIKEYIDSNQQLLQEVFEDSGPAWYIILDFDVADAIPNSGTSMWKNLGNTLSEQRQKQIETFQARQSDKKKVFARARAWLSLRTEKPSEAVSEADWSGMAKTLFWVGRLGIKWTVVKWVSEEELENILNSLPLNVLADLIIGLSLGYCDDFPSWMAKQRIKLMDRFRRETQTVVLEDDGHKLTAHFIVAIEQSMDSQANTEQDAQVAKDRPHTEAMQRIELLRRLLPDRKKYACQGYGHRLWAKPLPIDSTLKTGIPQSMLPLSWLTSINATFRGLAERQFRLTTWQEYAQEILASRQAVVQLLKNLEAELDIYFQKSVAIPLPSHQISSSNWLSLQRNLHKYALLPSCALDEWGFVDEYVENSANQQTGDIQSLLEKRGLIIQEYTPYLPAYREYIRTLSNFLDQAVETMIFNSRFGKGKNAEVERRKAVKQLEQEERRKIELLPTLNLADAVKILKPLQIGFRQLLSQYVDKRVLTEIEQKERNLFYHIWCMWYFFAYQPQTVYMDAKQKCPKQVMDVLKKVKQQILLEFAKLASRDLSITILAKDNLWEPDTSLWIIVNGKSALEVYNSVEQIIIAIRHATEKSEDIELQRYVLNFFWPQVAIVPLVCGKSLNALAWRITFLVLLQEEGSVADLNWWNFVLQPISRDEITKMDIAIWDLPRLEDATTLLNSTMELMLLTGHIRDFKSLPELDHNGKQILQQYLQVLMDHVSNALSILQASIAKITTIIKEIPSTDYVHRLNILLVVQALENLMNLILPPSYIEGMTEMSHEQFVEWADQLEKASEFAYSLYLLWATECLDGSIS